MHVDASARSPRSFFAPALLPLLTLAACVAAAPGGEERSTSSEQALARAAAPGVSVLTRNYDNQRTAANTAETVLRTANVTTSQFGKLFELPVDDQVYAQILYVSAIDVGGAVRNVIYAATVNNTVYAFDADAAGAPLWQSSFNAGGRPTLKDEVGQACGTYNDFSGNIGTVSTPVIDASTKTMYVHTRTVQAAGTVQQLHALDITTGAERAGSPVVIQASVPGTGDGSDPNGVLTFDPVAQNQRSSLALSNGTVYLAWASFCDTGPYHGWIMAYDAASLARVGVFNTTPGAGGGGIWQAGAAPAFDADGNLYYATGNGQGNNAFDGTSNFGETVLKLAPKTLGLVDYFTPSNFSTLDSQDADLGAAGASFLPGRPNLFVVGGKEGKGYLLDRTNLGHNVAGDTQIPQSWEAVDPTATPNATHHVHNTVAMWNGPAGLNMYVGGENDYLRYYRFDPASSRFTTPATAVSSVLPPLGMPGQMLSISSNGSNAGTGIVWSTGPRTGDANQAVVPGILRAYDAETLALLWDSSLPADDTQNFAKFSPPIVANGKVYVASFSNRLSVYGLLHPLVTDAGVDAAPDASVEAGVDAGLDSGSNAAPDAAIDSGSDAAADAAIDAATDAAIDAATDAAIDAATDAATDAAPTPDAAAPEDAGPSPTDAGPTVHDAGPTAHDAGPAAHDAGLVADAATPAAQGGGGEDTSGCGCRTAGARSEGPAPTLLGVSALAVAALFRRRRRAERAAA
jgi:MYXO-CTERM domain-containing protein